MFMFASLESEVLRVHYSALCDRTLSISIICLGASDLLPHVLVCVTCVA